VKATEIIFLIDQSGSMIEKKEETFSAFEQFLKEQCKVSGDCYISVCLFNTGDSGGNEYQDFDHAKITMLESKTPIDECKPLGYSNFHPYGGTPILDAVGISVDAARFMLSDDIDRQVVFVLLTDGEENSSRQYSMSTVHDLITYLRKGGWKFVYISVGENEKEMLDDDDEYPDSQDQAFKLGFTSKESFKIEKGQITKAVSQVSKVIADYRTTGEYKEIEWNKNTQTTPRQ